MRQAAARGGPGVGPPRQHDLPSRPGHGAHAPVLRQLLSLRLLLWDVGARSYFDQVRADAAAVSEWRLKRCCDSEACVRVCVCVRACAHVCACRHACCQCASCVPLLRVAARCPPRLPKSPLFRCCALLQRVLARRIHHRRRRGRVLASTVHGVAAADRQRGRVRHAGSPVRSRGSRTNRAPPRKPVPPLSSSNIMQPYSPDLHGAWPPTAATCAHNLQRI